MTHLSRRISKCLGNIPRIIHLSPKRSSTPNPPRHLLTTYKFLHAALHNHTTPTTQIQRSIFRSPLASPPMAACSRIVVVFDFDKTIIDCDSDNWVVDELGATHLFNALLPTMPWNTLMDTMMRELHAQGKTVDDIRNVLTSAPIHPRVVPAIKTAHALGCDLKVVSDANLFFIETILEHLGIRECFSEIYTNPGFVDLEGRLRIQPFNSSPHGCTNLCPPNMCKSGVIEKLQSAIPEKIFIYLGDGVGDYCPSLKLREEDHVLPRKNFPLWELISKSPMLIKAKIHEWSDGHELEKTLLQTISEICSSFLEDEDVSSQLVSADCKLQTMSALGVHEPLPRRALPMPH